VIVVTVTEHYGVYSGEVYLQLLKVSEEAVAIASGVEENASPLTYGIVVEKDGEPPVSYRPCALGEIVENSSDLKTAYLGGAYHG
jgi:hypothetical protein